MTSPVDFGTQLCEALGLDPKTINHINIEIPANDVVVVTIERPLFLEETAEAITNLLEKYTLEPLKQKLNPCPFCKETMCCCLTGQIQQYDIMHEHVTNCPLERVVIEADTCADAINLWNSWHKDALTQEQRG